ncbi:MAG: hypothetical protein VX642_11955 [Bdellovibrionota bacterium]|nr:hypothetical protein [Bdellovibrionota bacterium]
MFLNRNILSPYHLFFGSLLGLVFSMQSLVHSEGVFSFFVQNWLFYPELFSESRYELSPLYRNTLYFVDFLDKQNYYVVATILILLSFFFITDLYRDCKDRYPNKASTLVLMSMPFIYLLWRPQSGVILLLPVISLSLGLGHYLYRSLFAGCLSVLHPLGWIFLPQGLLKANFSQIGLSLFSFLLIPSIAFFMTKNFLFEEVKAIYCINNIAGSFFLCAFSYYFLSDQERISFRQKFSNLCYYLCLFSFCFFPEANYPVLCLVLILCIPSMTSENLYLAVIGLFSGLLLSLQILELGNHKVFLAYGLGGLACLQMALHIYKNIPEKTYFKKSSIL